MAAQEIPPSVAYVETDIPPGVTLAEYQARRAAPPRGIARRRGPHACWLALVARARWPRAHATR